MPSTSNCGAHCVTGGVFDLPPQTVQRYLTEKTVSPRMVWRFNHKIRSMPAGKILRIETLAPAVIHWSADDWNTVQDVTTHDVGLGIHIADLATKALPEGKQIKFTFYWPDADHWEGDGLHRPHRLICDGMGLPLLKGVRLMKNKTKSGRKTLRLSRHCHLGAGRHAFRL